MNILVLNGSPKGANSNTYQLAAAFLEGLNAAGVNSVQDITISKARIAPCLGCFACWTKTPGACAIQDDMAGLLQKYMQADLVIWSFPLYYFGMPSQIKAFMDRLLPLNLPMITAEGGHPPRYDLSHQRHILISTCGFFSVSGNYDALFRQFEIMFGDGLTKIICPQGELFRVPYLAGRTGEYLAYVKRAGEEYAAQGVFTQATKEKLSELLYPPEVFLEMANASWDVAETAPADEAQRPSGRAYKFLRQMAAIYNPAAYTKDIVLEMHFTDLNETYQLMLTKEKCVLQTEALGPYTTRIETPFETWLQISAGKISGPEAMMKRMYRVLGDFELMLRMDALFGAGTPAPKAAAAGDTRKNANMLLFLLPFLALWIFLPINSRMGALAGLFAAGVVQILHFWWKPTPYERIGAFTGMLISLYVLTLGGAAFSISLPSLAFGVMWTASCFLKIPLTSYYSCKDYGGEAAFDNPLFIRTNRILTAMWGIAYLLLGTASLFIAGTAIAPYWGIVTNVPTLLLGAFTVWFAKWYPAYYARGKRTMTVWRERRALNAIKSAD